MKKFISLILSLLVIIPVLSSSVALVNAQEDDSWQRVQDSGKLVVATSGTLVPNSYYSDNNELIGFDIDILKEVANRLDLELEFLEMGVDGMLTALQSGQVDIVANGFDITERRQEDFIFSDPIKYSFGTAVVRESDDSGIYSLEDFEGKKAAGGATTQYMQIAIEMGAEPVAYDNATNDQFYIDVASGRTDFIPHDYFVIKSAIEHYGDMDVKMADVYYNPVQSAYVYNQDSVSLKEKIDEVLAELREEGILTELSETYFNGEDVTQPFEEYNGVKIEDMPVIEVE